MLRFLARLVAPALALLGVAFLVLGALLIACAVVFGLTGEPGRWDIIAPMGLVGVLVGGAFLGMYEEWGSWVQRAVTTGNEPC